MGTIRLKRGAGAPSTGDLVEGEPGIDLTNKIGYFDVGNVIYYVGQYIPGSAGIDFIHAVDEDVDIITLAGITNTPKLYWDQSEDAHRLTRGLVVDRGLRVAGLQLAVVAKTAAYTATALDDVITCGAGNETFAIDLPAPSAALTAKVFFIKNVGTGVITVDANTTGGTTIDGSNTQTINQYECLQVISDASVYWAI
ncbi:hypothetical protein LCGC14_0297520 [marine sediment metagenome]|uniref:Major tropism determinant N-terminal domain-containing protein n=1 Tax=marine sediment metagenome TaxID=412755 RepID=A0A0F9TW10_9ZZZZ